MRGKLKVDRLDLITRAMLVIFLVAFSYLVFLLLLRPLFFPQRPFDSDMMGMMKRMMSYPSEGTLVYYVAALLPAMGLGLLLSLFLRAKSVEDDEYRILRRALSRDERRVLDEIKKAGEITQDSLRVRLDWSKAKVSRILTNLDKMNLIQRERTGKTYRVFLQKGK
ncbi:MAG: helix-turn-helix transcriptional regulator [Candidatus Bathyarchaeia archaeon]